MAFCILENDYKTFEYFKKYVEFLEKGDNDCLVLDNALQADEIRAHLMRNGFSDTDFEEKINWVNKNGKPFRDFLNTLKLAYVVWKGMGKKWEDITCEDFAKIEETLNTVKTKCLDTIF